MGKPKNATAYYETEWLVREPGRHGWYVSTERTNLSGEPLRICCPSPVLRRFDIPPREKIKLCIVTSEKPICGAVLAYHGPDEPYLAAHSGLWCRLETAGFKTTDQLQWWVEVER